MYETFDHTADLGLRVGAISLVTNRAAGLAAKKLDHSEVLEVARRSAEELAGLVERVAGRLGSLQ